MRPRWLAAAGTFCRIRGCSKSPPSSRISPRLCFSLCPLYHAQVILKDPPKQAALAYLDNRGPKPARMARVIIVRGAAKPRDVMEYAASVVCSTVQSTVACIHAVMHSLGRTHACSWQRPGAKAPPPFNPCHSPTLLLLPAAVLHCRSTPPFSHPTPLAHTPCLCCRRSAPCPLAQAPRPRRCSSPARCLTSKSQRTLQSTRSWCVNHPSTFNHLQALACCRWARGGVALGLPCRCHPRCWYCRRLASPRPGPCRLQEEKIGDAADQMKTLFRFMTSERVGVLCVFFWLGVQPGVTQGAATATASR